MNRPIANQDEPEHLLLAMAKTYPVSNPDLAPPGCRYSLEQGGWVLNDTGTLLVDTPGRPRPKTKKADLESGEDQKGA